MQIRRRLILTALVVILAPLSGRAQRATASERPLAITTAVSGRVFAETPGFPRRDVKTLDWFSAGTLLSTSAKASMVVVFQDGTRLRLGDSSQVRVTAGGPAEAKGTVAPLSPVPPLPQVSAVPLDGPATRINAVRVRGGVFASLRPDGAAVLADSPRLEFQTDREFASYFVSIEREDGSIAFETTTTSTAVDVPPHVLQPGTPYHWHVEAEDPLGRRARASARFVTLTTEQTARRQGLRKHLASSPEDSTFLAEIDRALGLLPRSH